MNGETNVASSTQPPLSLLSKTQCRDLLKYLEYLLEDGGDACREKNVEATGNIVLAGVHANGFELRSEGVNKRVSKVTHLFTLVAKRVNALRRVRDHILNGETNVASSTQPSFSLLSKTQCRDLSWFICSPIFSKCGLV